METCRPRLKCGIKHAYIRIATVLMIPKTKQLIDAKKVFNELNRQTELEMVNSLCPSLHVAFQNSYSHPSHLYIFKLIILSQEGTTQGDPLAMAMYGIAILFVITRLHNDSSAHEWYAGDVSVAVS